MPISSPGTMAMVNQAARESLAVTNPTSLSSNVREKLTGGVPLEDQQVTFPRKSLPSLEMKKDTLGLEV